MSGTTGLAVWMNTETLQPGHDLLGRPNTALRHPTSQVCQTLPRTSGWSPVVSIIHGLYTHCSNYPGPIQPQPWLSRTYLIKDLIIQDIFTHRINHPGSVVVALIILVLLNHSLDYQGHVQPQPWSFRTYSLTVSIIQDLFLHSLDYPRLLQPWPWLPKNYLITAFHSGPI